MGKRYGFRTYPGKAWVKIDLDCARLIHGSRLGGRISSEAAASAMTVAVKAPGLHAQERADPSWRAGVKEESLPGGRGARFAQRHPFFVRPELAEGRRSGFDELALNGPSFFPLTRDQGGLAASRHAANPSCPPLVRERTKRWAWARHGQRLYQQILKTPS